jgi:hypothetical protein
MEAWTMPVLDVASSTMLTLDDLLPAPHFRERHHRDIDAGAEAVWEALKEARLADATLSKALMGVRLLPAKLARKPLPPMVEGRFLEQGPVAVLAIDAGRAVVAGGAMQPWKLTGGDDPPVLDADGLRAFGEPGWVKTGIDFVLEAHGGGTRLTTETRITATDPRTRAVFKRYWLVIRAGSGLIRHDMLRAIARKAEASRAGA